MSADERAWKGIAQELQQEWRLGGEARARVWFENYVATRDQQQEKAILAAEARGFERAVEMGFRAARAHAAECRVEGEMKAARECEVVGARIRAMQDERGEGDESPCAGCQHPRWNHRNGPCGVFVVATGDRCPCAGFVTRGGP